MYTGYIPRNSIGKSYVILSIRYIPRNSIGKPYVIYILYNLQDLPIEFLGIQRIDKITQDLPPIFIYSVFTKPD